MAGFLDPVRPVEQGPGWNWNPGQTFVTAMNDAQRQKAALEKNALDMELEQILMPYKAQKAALDLDKLQAETEYLTGHTELQRAETAQKREMLNGLNATRKALLDLQNKQIIPGSSVGESLLDSADEPTDTPEKPVSANPDPYLPKVSPSSASDLSQTKVAPTDSQLDAQVEAMPNSDRAIAYSETPRSELTSDPNNFVSQEPSGNPISSDESENKRIASLFESLPAPGASTANNSSQITPTDISGMEKNSAAIDAAKKPKTVLDQVAKSLPEPKNTSQSGLNAFVTGYRSVKSEFGKLAATQANNPAALREIKAQWQLKDLELRNQAQELYGIPAVEGKGVFQRLVSSSDPTLSEIQKLKDKTGSWESAIRSAFAPPKAEKTEKPNEELNSLIYARKELASSLGDDASPEAKSNLAILDEKIKNLQRGITPEQAAQENIKNSRSYQLGEVSKWIGGTEPEKKSALLNLNSLIEKGDIPTISLKQGKDGKILYSKADQALLSKVEDGMPFAAVDSTGTRQILRKDSSSNFGFSRWGKLGDKSATTTTSPGTAPSVSEGNPFKESLSKIQETAAANAVSKEDEELADIEGRLKMITQMAGAPTLDNPAAWGSQLVRAVSPKSETKNLSDTWEKLNARKQQLLALKASRKKF